MQRSVRFFLCRSSSNYPFWPPTKPISPSLPRIPIEPPNPCFSTPSSPPKPHISTMSVSKFHFSSHTILPSHSTQFGKRVGGHRGFTSDESIDHSSVVDEINLKFAEAREEIEAALDSKETVYFDEEAECAREAAKVVIDMFDGLLEKLPEKERTALQRSMGLKIQQLKAEVQQLDD